MCVAGRIKTYPLWVTHITSGIQRAAPRVCFLLCDVQLGTNETAAVTAIIYLEGITLSNLEKQRTDTRAGLHP